MVVLLAVWALVSFGFGIWIREPLDAFSIGGAPLGFWFAQQGSIYVFVALIFVYAFAMKRLDARYDVDGADGPDAPVADRRR
jgi:putative solute:sodium symporter small subunit